MTDYVIHDGTGGDSRPDREKYFQATGTREAKGPAEYACCYRPGAGLAFKLDHDQVETCSGEKNKPPLFPLSSTTPRSRGRKRCDFVDLLRGRPQCVPAPTA